MSNSSTESKCPFTMGKHAGSGHGYINKDWWPNRLNLNILRQHSPFSDPMDPEFNYGEEFKKLNLQEVSKRHC